MQGHIQRRGGDSWRVSAYLGRDSTTGKKRYAQRTVRGTKREAQAVLARLVTEVNDGRYASAGALTVAELLERFFELKASQIEPGTLDGYRRVADYYVVPRIGTVKVAKLRAIDLDRLYATLLQSGGRGGRSLSPRTVRLSHVLLRQALAQAKRWGLLAVNPAEDATPPRDTYHEITPPSVEVVIRLLNGAMEADPDFGVYLRVLAVTGCRRGEALALRWRDLTLPDEGPGEVLISRSIALVGTEVVEKDTKTHQGRRLVLDAATVAVLHEHRGAWEEYAELAGTKVTEDSFLFSSSLDGTTPWRPDVATGRFARLCKELGIEGVRLHDLRHYVATSLAATGTPIATISSRLGHRDRATTLNIYSHSLPALDYAAAEVLGELLEDAEVDRGT
ncbi:MAG TPA: tyrosine-type recombinase/integrase [Acidimicrobiales bacterium]|nr:tyrosine-type recombinase/integrase [Acidimicrobiales bacterium]